MPPEQFAQAAQEALAKLSPEERAEFLEMLQERAADRGVKLPGKVASEVPGKGAQAGACLCAIVARVFAWRAISRVPLNPSRVDRTGLAPVCP